MIRAAAHGPNGAILLLGLTEDNLKLLPRDKPIRVDVNAMNLGNIAEVVIFAGVDENTMLEDFVRLGFINDKTELSIDPRTIPDRAPVDVVDTAIVRVPDRFDLTDPAKAQQQGPELQRTLRELAQKLIAHDQNLPEGVRKVEILQLVWTVTGNADDLAKMVPPHDCPKCRDGMGRAVDDLRQTPGIMAVGKLEYRMHFA